MIQGNTAGDVPPGTTVYPPECLLIGTIGSLPGSTTYASLLGAPGSNAPLSQLQVGRLGTAVGGGYATTFRTGAAAGNFAVATATFDNIPADAPVATFEMVAWDNSSGLYPTWAQAFVGWQQGLVSCGTSLPFNVKEIGGFINTPPNLVGLTSFNLKWVPEPGSVAIGGLAIVVLGLLGSRIRCFSLRRFERERAQV